MDKRDRSFHYTGLAKSVYLCRILEPIFLRLRTLIELEQSVYTREVFQGPPRLRLHDRSLYIIFLFCEIRLDAKNKQKGEEE